MFILFYIQSMVYAKPVVSGNCVGEGSNGEVAVMLPSDSSC